MACPPSLLRHACRATLLLQLMCAVLTASLEMPKIALGLGYHDSVGADEKGYLATKAWLAAGGRHLDASHGGPSYSDNNGSATAWVESKIPREVASHGAPCALLRRRQHACRD